MSCPTCVRIQRDDSRRRGTVRVRPWLQRFRTRRGAFDFSSYIVTCPEVLAVEAPSRDGDGWIVRAFLCCPLPPPANRSALLVIIDGLAAPRVVLRSALLAMPYVSPALRAA